MRVNSANVLDEGLRIGGRGCRMNSKVKIRQTRQGLTCIENKHSTQLAQSQSVPCRPLLAPLYRWLGLKEPVGFNTNYNVRIWCHLVFLLQLCLGLPNGPRGTKIMGFISYTLVTYRTLRNSDFDLLDSKFIKKLDAWIGGSNSSGGCLTLVNSSFSSLPSYFMSLFYLNNSILKKIDKHRRHFFLHGKKVKKGYYMVKWWKVFRCKKKGV
jgi:hypothetical protein